MAPIPVTSLDGDENQSNAEEDANIAPEEHDVRAPTEDTHDDQFDGADERAASEARHDSEPHENWQETVAEDPVTDADADDGQAGWGDDEKDF